MRSRHVVVVAALVGAAVGCHKDEAAPGKPGSAAAAAAGAPIVPPPDPNNALAILVDDQRVAGVTHDQLAAFTRLDAIVPANARRLGTWQDVYLVGASAKPSEIHKPADAHPDLVPAVYLAEDGTAAFGLFDPVELAQHGKPVVSESKLREVRIRLAQNSGRGEHEEGGGGAGADPSKLAIAVKTKTGTSTLEGSKLLAIPRVPMPGETGEGRGWTLATILDAAGIKQYKKLLLTDAGGVTLILEAADFDAAKSVPFVKLNRQGALRVQVFKKQGDGWQRGGDLRGLVGIQVLE